ncbi:hypothetical protein KFE25_008282 [Diacronema lutheri]|uniref:Uncharacterized protein n=1 Tax=Diacronema lutheri TaxID=2081491 RepID=A0A8J5XLB4_DIALT|nr:hypothetical protein KFE25_008282 [Diacronema lutheri]
MGADERRRQEGFDSLSRDVSLRPENSLGNAVHVASGAMFSAAGFALVGAAGARLAIAGFPRASKEMRWMAPSLTGSLAAILGAQQGTLSALADVQPTASFALLRADLDEALENEARSDAARGGNRTSTFVIREYKSWTPFWLGSRPVPPERTEMLVHKNVVDRDAVAQHQAAAAKAQRELPRAIPRPALTGARAAAPDAPRDESV